MSACLDPIHRLAKVSFLISIVAMTGALTGPGRATAGNTGVQIFQATVGQRVIVQAYAFLGEKIGRGECTDYVDLVLKTAFAKPGNNYVWGTEVTTIAPGDIIQFWNTKFTGPNGAVWQTNDKHTAVVVGISGSRVTLIHQKLSLRQPSYESGVRSQLAAYRHLQALSTRFAVGANTGPTPAIW
jgi:hypothetical protein